MLTMPSGTCGVGSVASQLQSQSGLDGVVMNPMTRKSNTIAIRSPIHAPTTTKSTEIKAQTILSTKRIIEKTMPYAKYFANIFQFDGIDESTATSFSDISVTILSLFKH